MKIKTLIHNRLKKRGYEVIRNPIRSFIQGSRFDVVLDVGANQGQFALEMRSQFGFQGRIVSFEPLNLAFALLEQNALRDQLWTPVKCGLGAQSSKLEINVSQNSFSSSFLKMLPRHANAAPSSKYQDVEVATIKTMDEVFDDYCSPEDKVFLKVDTQGFEMEVLKGASNSLSRIAAVQIELSLCPLYEGAPLIEDIIKYLRDRGFEPFWFNTPFWDPKTNQLLQIDGLFINNSLSKVV